MLGKFVNTIVSLTWGIYFSLINLVGKQQPFSGDAVNCFIA